MTFKAQLVSPVFANPKEPVNTTLQFTRTRIKFPNALVVSPFVESEIKNNARYTLKINDDLDKRTKYQIFLPNGKGIYLIINKKNEFKLRWIHKLYPFQNDATFATIISIISLLATIILGILQLIND